MDNFSGVSRQDQILLACMEERRKIGWWMLNQLISTTATKEEIERKHREMIFLGKTVTFLKQQRKRNFTLDELEKQIGKKFFEKKFPEKNVFKEAVSSDKEVSAYFCENCGWVIGHPRQEFLQSRTMWEADYYCNFCSRTIGIKMSTFLFLI